MLKKFLLITLCLVLMSCATLNSYRDDETAAHKLSRNAYDYRDGMRYLLGKGVPQNYTTARSYFEKSAENNNPYAESELGYMYTAGQGVPKNYMMALQWYVKAANHGLASAQYNAGLMYAHGIGTPVNKMEARKWLQEAAQRGFGPARTALGSL